MQGYQAFRSRKHELWAVLTHFTRSSGDQKSAFVRPPAGRRVQEGNQGNRPMGDQIQHPSNTMGSHTEHVYSCPEQSFRWFLLYTCPVSNPKSRFLLSCIFSSAVRKSALNPGAPCSHSSGPNPGANCLGSTCKPQVLQWSEPCWAFCLCETGMWHLKRTFCYCSGKPPFQPFKASFCPISSPSGKKRKPYNHGIKILESLCCWSPHNPDYLV